MNQYIPDLTASQWLLFLTLFFIIYLLIEKIVKLIKILLKKKKKGKWEYYVEVFFNDNSLTYGRDQVDKVKTKGRKSIAIKLKNGDWVSYEGFRYTVNSYWNPTFMNNEEKRIRGL